MATMKAIDTRSYEVSQGRKPKPAQEGVWWFEASDGDKVSLTGQYRHAVQALSPNFTWKVLP
jgi:hypothetical protein